MSTRTLNAVYYPNVYIFYATLGSHPSQIWRAVLDSRYVLAQGIIQRIGDGHTTRIWEHFFFYNWEHNWLLREELNASMILVLVHLSRLGHRT